MVADIRRMEKPKPKTVCLNPCFDGIWSLTSIEDECAMIGINGVLILVLMEYGL